MVLHVRPLREPAAAKVARERTRARVRHFVPSHVTTLLEHFAAERAGEA